MYWSSIAPSRGVRIALVLTWGALALPGMLCAFDPERTITQHVRRTWTTEDGLPQSSANALVQDRHGYLWIATYAGLARFDGVRFETYTKAQYPELPSNRLLALFEDSEGTLWIGTERHGLATLRDGIVRPFELPPGVPSCGVAFLGEGPSGDLWVGTSRGALRIRSGRLVARYAKEDGLAGDLVRTVLEEPDGTVWLGGAGGLARMDHSGQISSVPALEGLDLGQGVHALLRDRFGVLWIGSDRGLFRVTEGRAEQVSLGEGLKPLRVHVLLEDRHGGLWIGLEPGGLYRLKDGRLDSYDKNDGLPVDLVVDLLEDREGNLWVGTTGGGLHELSEGKAVPYGGPRSLLDMPTLPIVTDGEGGIWVGLNCGGLAHLTASGTTVLDKDDGLLNGCVWSLHRDADGTLWIGTHGGRLHRMRPGSAEPRIEPLNGPETREGVVRSVVRTRSGDLVIGTDQGLFRYLPARSEFVRFAETEGLDISFIEETEDGLLWLGTDQGAHVVGHDSRVHPVAAANAVWPGLVRAVYHDDRGIVWIGTYGGGLIRLEEGRATTFDTRNGLPDDVVSRILEDRHGRFWMTGNRGVYRVDRIQLDRVADGVVDRVQAVLYGASSGMLSSECNGGGQPAGALAEDGTLWVPTIEGVARIDTEIQVTNPTMPPVLIEKVLLDGEPIDLSDPVVLAPRARNLEIHYTALSFVAPEHVRFHYRLVGFDEHWIDAGTRRVAYYPLIPPGEHRFQVTAANEDGAWNPTGASFTFTAEPGLENTPWPYAGGFAVLGVVVWLTIRRRMRAALLRQSRLEHEVRARTEELLGTKRELEEANRILQQLAVEDPLTGVANRRAFEERLDQELRRAARERQPIGVLMIDVDGFKAYNDALGHGKGDECLVQVARALAGALRRAGDLLARYGGEEFAAILPDTDSDELTTLAETLRRRIEELDIAHPNSAVSRRVTVSLGGASVVPWHRDDSTRLVRTADQALYEAKRAGKNRSRVRSLASSGLAAS